MDVLAFVARRLEAESVALMFAGRDVPVIEAQLAGSPRSAARTCMPSRRSGC